MTNEIWNGVTIGLFINCAILWALIFAANGKIKRLQEELKDFRSLSPKKVCELLDHNKTLVSSNWTRNVWLCKRCAETITERFMNRKPG